MQSILLWYCSTVAFLPYLRVRKSFTESCLSNLHRSNKEIMLRVTNSWPEMRHIIQIEINNGIKTHNIYYESKQVASNNHTCQNKITHIYLFKGHLAFGINRLIHFDFPCHHHVLHLQQQCTAIDRTRLQLKLSSAAPHHLLQFWLQYQFLGRGVFHDKLGWSTARSLPSSRYAPTATVLL